MINLTNDDNKVGVIDVGSNSVRLMLSKDGIAIFKKVQVTRLAEGLADKSVLTESAITRTANAVRDFYRLALQNGAKKVYAFATAAVRQSENGKAFTDRVEELCGLKVDVIDGETEAEIGYMGALQGADGGIIDVGGASTEITVVKNCLPVYGKSLNIGSVRVTTACGQAEEKAVEFIADAVKEYGEVPSSNFYGIGGTATTLVAIAEELEIYDPAKVDGYKLTRQKVSELTKKLYGLSVEERQKLKGLQPERAEVIAGGSAILSAVMEMLNVDYITVSEKDNLEGYLIKKVKKDEKKN